MRGALIYRLIFRRAAILRDEFVDGRHVRMQYPVQIGRELGNDQPSQFIDDFPFLIPAVIIAAGIGDEPPPRPQSTTFRMRIHITGPYLDAIMP